MRDSESIRQLYNWFSAQSVLVLTEIWPRESKGVDFVIKKIQFRVSYLFYQQRVWNCANIVIDWNFFRCQSWPRVCSTGKHCDGRRYCAGCNNLQHVNFGVYHFSILYGSNALGYGEHSGQRFLQSHFRQPPFAFPSCDFDEWMGRAELLHDSAALLFFLVQDKTTPNPCGTTVPAHTAVQDDVPARCSSVWQCCSFFQTSSSWISCTSRARENGFWLWATRVLQLGWHHPRKQKNAWHGSME